MNDEGDDDHRGTKWRLWLMMMETTMTTNDEDNSDVDDIN